METHLETEKVKNPSLFGLITHPGEQFERMREKPAVWFPLVIVLLLSVTGAYMLSEKRCYLPICRKCREMMKHLKPL